MRIAICGAHGTGKTTLAKQLAKELGLALISGMAREAAKNLGYKNCEEIRWASYRDKQDFQMDTAALQLQQEMTLCDGFVSDRSFLDISAYSKYYGLTSWDDGLITGYANAKYDVLLYCPIPDAKIANDNFRLLSNVSRRDVDRLILSLFIKTQCQRVILPKAFSPRLEVALDFIENAKKEAACT